MEQRNMSQSTALCQSGCGFYGNAATDGLCSKCYRDVVMRKQAVPASAPAAAAAVAAAAAASAAVSEMSSSSPSPPPLILKPSVAATSQAEAHLCTTAAPTVAPFPAVSAQLSPKSEADTSGTDGSGSGIRNQDEGTGSASNVVASASSASPSPVSSLKDGLQCPATTTEPPLLAVDVKKKAKNRCSVCKVKVGVIGFPCRCGGTFCSVHRYANEHACSFDYREHGQTEIRKNNPQIVGEKIQKI